MITLGLDIGSNSVGSAWVDTETKTIQVGVSVFPAGVVESDEKRGAPLNVKRRSARRTRITLARRAKRKRQLRLYWFSVKWSLGSLAQASVRRAPRHEFFGSPPFPVKSVFGVQ
jgi:CRISPR/Cas system Type II protein with McrA/HNH and RuvC-like nuclease domain